MGLAAELEKIAGHAGVQPAERVVDILRLDMKDVGVDPQADERIQFIGPLKLHIPLHEDRSGVIQDRVQDRVIAEGRVAAGHQIFSAGPLIRGIPQDHLINHLQVPDGDQRKSIVQGREVPSGKMGYPVEESSILRKRLRPFLSLKGSSHMARPVAVGREEGRHVGPVRPIGMLSCCPQ